MLYQWSVLRVPFKRESKSKSRSNTITNQSKGRLRSQSTLKLQTIQAQSLTRRKIRELSNSKAILRMSP